jgi:hypothetical protein
VAFARRPGRFAVAVPVGAGQPLWFATGPDRHFFGHGVFSADGRLLYSIENDYNAAKGLHNYIGSVAADSSGSIVAASAAKGGLVTYWDLSARRYLGFSDLNDGCGLAPTHHQANFLLTSGEGWLATADSSGALERQASNFPVGQPRDPGALKSPVSQGAWHFPFPIMTLFIGLMSELIP